jgi:hypothetical protein
MLEFLSLAWWVTRFFAAYPFVWLARAFNFLASVVGGYHFVVVAGIVRQSRFGYAAHHRSEHDRKAFGQWTADVDEAEARLIWEVNRAVVAHKAKESDE